MTTRLYRIRALLLASVASVTFFVMGPALAFAHVGHETEGGVDLMTTLQVAGVVALLGLGYVVISRQGRRHESDRRDPGR